MPFPEEGEVYDYEFVKEGLGKWVLWSDKLIDAKPIAKDAHFNSIIIPTVDTVRSTYLMDMCVKHEKPCLFVGPTGTGKSVYIQVIYNAYTYMYVECQKVATMHTCTYVYRVDDTLPTELHVPR